MAIGWTRITAHIRSAVLGHAVSATSREKLERRRAVTERNKLVCRPVSFGSNTHHGNVQVLNKLTLMNRLAPSGGVVSSPVSPPSSSRLADHAIASLPPPVITP